MHVLINALGIDNRSGTGRYMFGLLDGIRQQSDCPIRFTVPVPASFQIPAEWHTCEWLQFHPIALPSTRSRIRWEQCNLPAFARRTGADLLYSTAFVSPLFLSQSITSVVTIHDLAYERYPETIPFARRMYYRFTIPRSIRNATAIITDSAAVQHVIQNRWTTKNVYPIHLGINPTLYHPRQQKSDEQTLAHYKIEKPFFLFVGTQEPRKNLDLLRKAMLHAQACGSPAMLILAGRFGWMQNRSELNRESIRAIGFVPDEDLAALYRTCSAYCAPSLDEGFDLPSVEASACGAPVLASDIAVHREVLPPGTRFIDPTDVAAWTQALCESPQRIRSSAKPRTWKETASETVQVYQSVLGG